MHHTEKSFFFIGIAVVLIGIAVFLFVATVGSPTSPVSVSSPVQENKNSVAAVPVADESLGAQILTKSQNPIEGKVPTVAPETNPIKEAYKNPFE